MRRGMSEKVELHAACEESDPSSAALPCQDSADSEDDEMLLHSEGPPPGAPRGVDHFKAIAVVVVLAIAVLVVVIIGGVVILSQTLTTAETAPANTERSVVEAAKECSLVQNSKGVPCTGSDTFLPHSGCSFSTFFHGTPCVQVRSEVMARLRGEGGWRDRKQHPGHYQLIKSGVQCIKAQRTTGKGASPGPYTDLFGLVFLPKQNGCQLAGCSESQVASLLDFSTNFCNMYNLVCNEEAGCPKAKDDLTGFTKITYHRACTHGGKPEHDKAQCTRRL